MEKIHEILNQIEPISLSEMDSVRLQNRTDTKYVLNYEDLLVVLNEVKHDYRILEINDKRISSYKTLYFDTPEYDFYHLHQRGKSNRHKIRMRKYVESAITFLEIKFKNSKSRTIKNRVNIDDFEFDLSEESKRFISEISGIRSDLKPVMWNSFNRLTLVNEAGPERATIDLGLSFDVNDSELALNNIVIIEVKQEMINRGSPLVQALKRHHIRPMGMSKYCLGLAMTKSSLKKNNFKERILKIKKINGNAA